MGLAEIGCLGCDYPDEIARMHMAQNCYRGLIASLV